MKSEVGLCTYQWDTKNDVICDITAQHVIQAHNYKEAYFGLCTV